MPAKLFGQYLVEKQIISELDLAQAIKFQEINNLKFGDLVIQMDLLTAEQVNLVLEAQKKEGIRFGDLAFKLGFLSEEQVETIIKVQKNIHVNLGQILVSLGALTNKDLKIHLDQFRETSFNEVMQSLEVQRKRNVQLTEQLAHLATHDSITGLPNRSLFIDRMKQALSVAQRRKLTVSLLIIDLDNFKNVNESFGHPVGDGLLKAVADRLRKVVRASDTLAHLGVDEFVVIISGAQRVENLIIAVENLQDSLNAPLNVEGHEIYLSATMGIAHFPEDGDNLDELFKKAEIALHHAKNTSRGSFKFYDKEMNRLLSERFAIEGHLRHAIRRNELSLLYQPKFDLIRNRVSGAEVLLRWNNAELGEVPPERFIPVAEDTGMIVQLGNWVIKSACQQLKVWQDAGYQDLHLAINLSPRQLEKNDLFKVVEESLLETAIEPHCLELELTESMLMKDPEKSIGLIETIKATGVKVAMDDFGTGYSSLSYVGKLPIDRIKIDKSFVDDMFENNSKPAVVRMILVLAQSLGLAVTAEGVEALDQLEFLRTMGCHEIQGYLLSPPQSSAEFVNFLNAPEAFSGIGAELSPTV